jgi:DNA topoisomerase-1
VRAKAQLPAPETAKVAGLRHVNDQRMPGIRRIGSSHRVRYVAPNGRTVGDRTELARIKSLVIPPAWKDVWICPDPRGHVQATGRDARGRKQYRYHPRWRQVRDEVKYGRLIAFAQALPGIRRRTAADLESNGLSREKVLAAAVQLLEKTLIRVGNEEYARENGSVGLTTMRDSHAKIDGGTVRFEFRGKSGVRHAVDLQDARLAKIVKACRDLPGYELFQYVDEKGERQTIDSADVNAYLREVSGEDFTAKDFRTWAGTVLAAKALAEVATFASTAEAKRNVVKAIESVAKRLGNTKAVCRKCYIHPAILDAYMDGATISTLRARAARLAKARASLNGDEAAIGTTIQLQQR